MFKALKRIFSARMQFLYLNGLEQEKKEQSVRLAVQGLILSIVGAILSVGLVVAGTLCAQQFTVTTDAGAVSAILGLFGAIVFYALALVSFIGGVLDGISFSLLQTKLNKKNCWQGGSYHQLGLLCSFNWRYYCNTCCYALI